MAAHESPVLVMVDTETCKVFAHVCKAKGADPDILEALMEDIEVLCQRQVLLNGDQENPVKAVQRELAARRPEMKLENSPTYHSAANGTVKTQYSAGWGEPRGMTFMVNHARQPS